jgi:hypothetical protein
VPSRGSSRLKLAAGMSALPKQDRKRQAEHESKLGKAIEGIANAQPAMDGGFWLARNGGLCYLNWFATLVKAVSSLPPRAVMAPIAASSHGDSGSLIETPGHLPLRMRHPLRSVG